jgi:hypothetical protein
MLSGFMLAVPLLLQGADNSWTNCAGHALKATPLSISGQTVTFVKTNTGQTVSYPLSVFLPSEQERLRCALKEPTIPEGLQAAYEFSARIITRSRLLKANNSLSEKEEQKAVEKSVAAFRAQAAPFVVQKQLSHERIDLLVQELVATKEAAGPSPKEATALTP